MNKKNLKKYTLIFSASVAFSITGWVTADIKNFGNEIPDEADIIDALKPQNSVMPIQSTPKYPLKTRGIRVVTPNRSLSKEAEVNSVTPASSASEPAGASFSGLTFGFNSAELTQPAKIRLDKIGGALQNSELSNFTFRIEGHTDSTGGKSYNSWLSAERAGAVRDYLIQKFSIKANRLEITGKGESDPLNKEDPQAAENRRVQIVNLGTK